MIGDALALAGWAALFDDGLILDPRTILSAMTRETVARLVRCAPVDSGVHRIALAELRQRAGALQAPWSWEVVGIGCAVVWYWLSTEISPAETEVYSRDSARDHAVRRSEKR